MAFVKAFSPRRSQIATPKPALCRCPRLRCNPPFLAVRRTSPRATHAPSTINFGHINLHGAGSLKGFVFEPEIEAPLSTRVSVGFTTHQEEALNTHINAEYGASYAYHAVWSYFDRDNVNLPGFAKFFSQQSLEEREHAEHFMKYNNQRGGRVKLHPIAVPEMEFDSTDGTSDAIHAMDLHLQIEKFVFRKLNDLHKVAQQANDAQMQDFVEGYLQHQVDAVKTAADYVAQLKRVRTPHAVYHFDLALRGAEHGHAHA